ncbi:MAG: zf-HC2 domain-containing protein, partial [Chloroflexi bacterium]|nr:zf-HC2 domain-containing protein [Chloroflexota bacterium]
GDDIELYALGRLAETDTAGVEEHLLICGECQERLADWDVYARAMRAAIKATTGEKRSRAASNGEAQGRR